MLARVESVRDHPLPSLPGQGRRGRTEVVVTDERAKLVLTFFFKGNYRPGYLRPIVPGIVGMFAGTVSTFRASASWSTRSASCSPARSRTPN